MPNERPSRTGEEYTTPSRLAAFTWMRPIIALALVAIGLASGAASFAASLGRQAPEAAIKVWPLSGDAYERAATFELVQTVEDPRQGIPSNLPHRIAELSREAMRLEPANSTAVRNLAFYLGSRGQEDRAFRLMQVAQRVTRRDPGANLWLMQYYSRKGDLGRSLALYDVTIRTSSAAASSMMTMLAQALFQPGSVDVFVQLLSTSPPWIDDFWTEALRGSGDPQIMFALRERLHRAKVRMEPEHDGLLIEKLASGGHIDKAFALNAVVLPPRDRTDLLSDPSFDAARTFPPIGWKLGSDSTFGVSLDRKEGVIDVTALPDAEGVIAQQAVSLGGARSFRVVGNYQGAGARPLEISLACADSGNSGEAKADIPSGRATTVTMPAPCRFAWASLLLPRDDDPAGRAVRIGSLSLRTVE
jgi:hypothetical protein